METWKSRFNIFVRVELKFKNRVAKVGSVGSKNIAAVQIESFEAWRIGGLNVGSTGGNYFSRMDAFSERVEAGLPIKPFVFLNNDPRRVEAKQAGGEAAYKQDLAEL